MKEPLTTVRLDRWLMAARFYKTRSQAANACNGGKIKVNSKSSKPHKVIRIGDKITVHHHDRYRNIEVLGLAQRGLPPKLARELYHEEVKPVLTKEAKEYLSFFRKVEKKFRSKYKGRPTKKERRDLEKFKDMM
jgi:ribosome-associated heat shock protein Hsp15